MFKNLPDFIKRHLFPNVSRFNKNYFFLQFNSMKIIPAFYIILKIKLIKILKKIQLL